MKNLNTANEKQLMANYARAKIDYEYDGSIEKYVPKMTAWHHEDCRVKPNGDPEGPVFYPLLS